MRAVDLPDIVIRWICSFLQCRRQRVKIGDITSDWLELVAGMPQGRSYLGPLTFVIMIDALHPTCVTHKFDDDTTMTEILHMLETSCMELNWKVKGQGHRVTKCKNILMRSSGRRKFALYRVPTGPSLLCIRAMRVDCVPYLCFVYVEIFYGHLMVLRSTRRLQACFALASSTLTVPALAADTSQPSTTRNVSEQFFVIYRPRSKFFYRKLGLHVVEKMLVEWLVQAVFDWSIRAKKTRRCIYYVEEFSRHIWLSRVGWNTDATQQGVMRFYSNFPKSNYSLIVSIQNVRK